MIFLLDTNTLYAWLSEPDRLSPTATEAIENQSNSPVVSAAVPWELAMKTNLGRLNCEKLLAAWNATLEEQGFTELAIDSGHVIRAGLMPWHHNDPFDRVLAAQAQAMGWPIVSANRVFDFYGVQRIW